TRHGAAAAMVRLAAPLAQQALVVRAVVAAEMRDLLHGLVEASQLLAQLIRERQDQRDARLRVARVDREHVEADALRLVRLVEQAVALGLLHRGGDAVPGKLLQLVDLRHAASPPSGRPRTRGTAVSPDHRTDRPLFPSAE